MQTEGALRNSGLPVLVKKEGDGEWLNAVYKQTETAAATKRSSSSRSGQGTPILSPTPYDVDYLSDKPAYP
ncbi:hypothetical protein V5O48_019268, partial [Marasmius crinis-equi]